MISVFVDSGEKLLSSKEWWFSTGAFPPSGNLPTGQGKTFVVAVWLIARALLCIGPILAGRFVLNHSLSARQKALF
jgi:hypothetical protein